MKCEVFLSLSVVVFFLPKSLQFLFFKWKCCILQQETGTFIFYKLIHVNFVLKSKHLY